MEFIPLFFAERLRVVNPRGVIGVVTLWSGVDYVMHVFRRAGVDLNPESSAIAVFGTLYGNGLREMLRNLLYNPQIQVLLVCGHDRSNSQAELWNFFHLGVEPVPSEMVRYCPVPGVEAVSVCRIRHTGRVLDDLVRPEMFARPPRVVILGDPQAPATLGQIQAFFRDFVPEDYPCPERRAIPLPEVQVHYFPSNPRGHQVVRETPLAAWKEVLYLLTRFGRRVTLKKGDRLELQHVKVVVERPLFEPETELRACQVDPEHLRRYQQDLLRGDLRPDEAYHYGHRLRSYFGVDTLAACVARLQADPEDRKAYITLWDDGRDLAVVEGRPCLVSLFFRQFDGKLTLGATFRTHNALDAWLVNVYGLMAVQQWVAAQVGLEPGPLTIVSHSLGLDPKELDRALSIIGRRPFRIDPDPCGYFRVSVDDGEILVEHRYEDFTLATYRGKSAVALQHQLARDLALSDINHALYLGRQLAKAEWALKEGRPFIQD